MAEPATRERQRSSRKPHKSNKQNTNTLTLTHKHTNFGCRLLCCVILRSSSRAADPKVKSRMDRACRRSYFPLRTRSDILPSHGPGARCWDQSAQVVAGVSWGSNTRFPQGFSSSFYIGQAAFSVCNHIASAWTLVLMEQMSLGLKGNSASSPMLRSHPSTTKPFSTVHAGEALRRGPLSRKSLCPSEILQRWAWPRPARDRRVTFPCSPRVTTRRVEPPRAQSCSLG